MGDDLEDAKGTETMVGSSISFYSKFGRVLLEHITGSLARRKRACGLRFIHELTPGERAWGNFLTLESFGGLPVFIKVRRYIGRLW